MSTHSADRPVITLGADGWRGRIGESFSVASAAAVGAAAAQVLAAHGARSVMVGHDARQLSRPAAQAVARAAAAHMQTVLLPHVPTPIAGNALREGIFDAAILVTASHNAAAWNGVKVRIAPGIPVGRKTEEAIDRLVGATGPPRGAAADVRVGDARAVAQLAATHLQRALDAAGSGAGQPARIVVDGLHGIAGGSIADLCRALGWQTRELGTTPHCGFHGLVPDPVRADSRGRACREILRTGADFGLVVDGDGDRLWILNERGEALPPAVLFALLLEEEAAVQHLAQRLPIAVTVSCGAVVSRVCSGLGLTLLERPIGFKHIAPLIAGGEAGAGAGGVGDLAFAPYCFDRDPAMALALLARLLKSRGTTRPGQLAEQLTDRYGRMFRQERHIPWYATDDELHETGHAVLERLALSEQLLGTDQIDGIKFHLREDAWILLRRSSTEGGTRIFSEMRDPVLNQIAADALESAFASKNCRR